MSAEEDNDLPSVKNLLQVLNAQKKFTEEENMIMYFLAFVVKVILFTELHICSSRRLGKRWSSVWWNWPRLVQEFSSSYTSFRPSERRLSWRCLVLRRSSTMIPWHCKSLYSLLMQFPQMYYQNND